VVPSASLSRLLGGRWFCAALAAALVGAPGRVALAEEGTTPGRLPPAPATAEAPVHAPAQPPLPGLPFSLSEPPPSAESAGLPSLRRSSSWSVGGYGELILSNRFFSPNPKDTTSHRRYTDLDLARVSLFLEAPITSWLSFGGEIEFEHGGTGVTKEIEWEEFGEYEVEVEKGGEIALEQAYLEAKLHPTFSVRAGHILVPVGMTTMYHLPSAFASARRPESEAHVIPSVWHETGVELLFRRRPIHVRLQALTGLDSTGFSSDRWIAGGSQKMFESLRANDIAVALNIDFVGLPGTVIGVSGYTSGTTLNRPKADMDDVSARVLLGDVHVRGQYGPLRVRALALAGHLSNADAITRQNASLSNKLGVPRTPVASGAYAVFVEATADVLGVFRAPTTHRLDVFARFDAYDSMWHAGSKYANPLMERILLTTGLNYLPHPRVVLKAEYLSRWINQDRSFSLHQNEANAAIGFTL
jgi:hypothetical protein